MSVTPLDHARNSWRQATACLEALEKNRFAYMFKSWVGAAEIRAYDQRVASARAWKDQAFAEYRAAKLVAPKDRPVKLAKSGPVVLPRSARRARQLSEAQHRQLHAALDATNWALFGTRR